MITSKNGITIRMEVGTIQEAGRSTQGVKRTRDDSVARVPDSEPSTARDAAVVTASESQYARFIRVATSATAYEASGNLDLAAESYREVYRESGLPGAALAAGRSDQEAGNITSAIADYAAALDVTHRAYAAHSEGGARS